MITEPLKRLELCYWMKPHSFVEAKFLALYYKPAAVRVIINGKDFILKPAEVVTQIQKEIEFKRMRRDKFLGKYSVEITHIRSSIKKHGFKKKLAEALEIPYSRVFLIFNKAKKLGVDLNEIKEAL